MNSEMFWLFGCLVLQIEDSVTRSCSSGDSVIILNDRGHPRKVTWFNHGTNDFEQLFMRGAFGETSENILYQEF